MPLFPIQIHVIAVGKLRQSIWQPAAAAYLSRLQNYAEATIWETRDHLGRGRSEAEALEEEGREIIRRIRPEALVCLLDRNGRSLSSEQFAEFLKRKMDSGQREYQFIIGGPAGLDPSLGARAAMQLSLSPMTMPHEMARVVLLEQLYRAFTILRGEKYHK